MGCSNSKEAGGDHFEVVSRSPANLESESNEKTGPLPNKKPSKSSSQEKVYQNKQKSHPRNDNYADDTSSDEPEVSESVPHADGIRDVTQVKVEVHKLDLNAKSTSEDFTSEEDQLSPRGTPPRTQKNKEPNKKLNHNHDAATPKDSLGNQEDYMTPVIIGHGGNHHQHHHHHHKDEGKGQHHNSKQGNKTKDEPPPASVETKLKAVVRMQKLFRQRKHWKHVIEEREWKVASSYLIVMHCDNIVVCPCISLIIIPTSFQY